MYTTKQKIRLLTQLRGRCRNCETEIEKKNENNKNKNEDVIRIPGLVHDVIRTRYYIYRSHYQVRSKPEKAQHKRIFRIISYKCMWHKISVATHHTNSQYQQK